MEMVIVIGLGALALAFIEQQNESMRRMKRIRIEKSQRDNG
ncbi:MAG: DUF3918 family protein [Woeseiaceae bacterium]|nr:DUF3918 family protein [Woeseiaceae bacterium]